MGEAGLSVIGALVGETGPFAGLEALDKSDFCLVRKDATGGLSLLETACVEDERKSDEGLTLLVCSISKSFFTFCDSWPISRRAYTGGFFFVTMGVGW